VSGNQNITGKTYEENHYSITKGGFIFAIRADKDGAEYFSEYPDPQAKPVSEDDITPSQEQ
jgi:hypothetical protein